MRSGKALNNSLAASLDMAKRLKKQASQMQSSAPGRPQSASGRPQVPQDDLPPGWVRVPSRSKPGAFYYAHPATNRTQVEHPGGSHSSARASASSGSSRASGAPAAAASSVSRVPERRPSASSAGLALERRPSTSSASTALDLERRDSEQSNAGSASKVQPAPAAAAAAPLVVEEDDHSEIQEDSEEERQKQEVQRKAQEEAKKAQEEAKKAQEEAKRKKAEELERKHAEEAEEEEAMQEELQRKARERRAKEMAAKAVQIKEMEAEGLQPKKEKKKKEKKKKKRSSSSSEAEVTLEDIQKWKEEEDRKEREALEAESRKKAEAEAEARRQREEEERKRAEEAAEKARIGAEVDDAARRVREAQELKRQEAELEKHQAERREAKGRERETSEERNARKREEELDQWRKQAETVQQKRREKEAEKRRWKSQDDVEAALEMALEETEEEKQEREEEERRQKEEEQRRQKEEEERKKHREEEEERRRRRDEEDEQRRRRREEEEDERRRRRRDEEDEERSSRRRRDDEDDERKCREEGEALGSDKGWTCPFCSEPNKALRTECNNCGKARPAEAHVDEDWRRRDEGGWYQKDQQDWHRNQEQHWHQKDEPGWGWRDSNDWQRKGEDRWSWGQDSKPSSYSASGNGAVEPDAKRQRFDSAAPPARTVPPPPPPPGRPAPQSAPAAPAPVQATGTIMWYNGRQLKGMVKADQDGKMLAIPPKGAPNLGMAPPVPGGLMHGTRVTYTPTFLPSMGLVCYDVRPLEGQVGLSCGGDSQAGGRGQNEDRTAAVDLPDGLGHLVGILDGHRGFNCADFLAQRLPQAVVNGMRDRFTELHSSERAADSLSTEEEVQAIRQGLIAGFEACDRDFLSAAKANSWGDGSCALLALLAHGFQLPQGYNGDAAVGTVENAPGGVAKCFVAWSGTSRMVLLRGRQGFPCTRDHVCAREDEYRRLQSQGALFAQDPKGVWWMGPPDRLDLAQQRQQGYEETGPKTFTAASRGFGDVQLKEAAQNYYGERTATPVLMVTPEVSVVDLTPADWAIVLAGRGVFSVLSDQDVADICLQELGTMDKGPVQAARAVTARAMQRGARDNLTCIVMRLGWAKPPTQPSLTELLGARNS